MPALDTYTRADLDQLLEALEARARDRAVTNPVPVYNDAGELVGPGTFANGRVTVHPGDTIASTWGNTVWDQSTQCFASAADRDAQYLSPHDGAMVYQEDTRTYWSYRSGAWQQTRTGHACRVRRNNAFTFPATANQLVYPFLFDTETYDAENLYSTATGLYTCPVAGIYFAYSTVAVSLSVANSIVTLNLYRNGVSVHPMNTAVPIALSAYPVLVDAYPCNAGDTLGISAQANMASPGVRTGLETIFCVTFLGPL